MFDLRDRADEQMLWFLAALGLYGVAQTRPTYQGAAAYPPLMPPAPAPEVKTAPTIIIDPIIITGRIHAVDIMARTIWGEARGEGFEGMAAVANVIMNRSRISSRSAKQDWWGETIEEICFRRISGYYQFSCWDPRDPNREKAANVRDTDVNFRTALSIAMQAYSGALPDRTGGATHYHSKSVRPYWAKSGFVTADIGSHLFYQVA